MSLHGNATKNLFIAVDNDYVVERLSLRVGGVTVMYTGLACGTGARRDVEHVCKKHNKKAHRHKQTDMHVSVSLTRTRRQTCAR